MKLVSLADRASMGIRTAKPLQRRTFLVGASLGLGVLLGHVRAARADLFGGDVAVLIGIAKQLYQSWMTARQQLDQARYMVEYSQRSVRALGEAAKQPPSVGSLLALYDSTNATWDMMKNNVDKIGFEARGLHERFAQLFPDRKRLENAKYSDYRDSYPTWQGQIHSAARAAAEAQANAVDIDAKTRESMRIMSTRGPEDGLNQRMDRVLEMLALIQSQLTVMTQTAATGERVTTSMAAAAASEQMVEREMAKRARDSKVRTKVIAVPKRLP